MASSLVEILEQNGVDVRTDHRDVRQGWIGLQCPWCGGPDEYYLGVNTEWLACNCWRCGPHKISEVLVELLGISKYSAVQKIKDLPRAIIQERKVTGRYEPPRDVGKLRMEHRDYLRSRGFSPKHLAKVWGVEGIGPRSKWAWRLFIPAFEHGKPVSWTTRSINPDEDHSRRYLAAPPERERVPLKEILYGGDLCRHACLVVEGPTGAWKIGPGTVATNGTSYSASQIELMASYAVRVVTFDHEPEAQKRARKLTDVLGLFPGETYNVDLDSADPGEATEKEIRKLRKAFLE